MVCTNDKKIYDLLKMIRSHGWDRDLDPEAQQDIRTKYNVNNFEGLYTFYVPGFNIRSTDLQAFIGINQMDKLENITQQRTNNFNYYQANIINPYWKVASRYGSDPLSNFAYPIIHPKRTEIVAALAANGIETRPLICGSLAKQPFFKNKYYCLDPLPCATMVHEFGLYIPNNEKLEAGELELICKIINQEISK